MTRRNRGSGVSPENWHHWWNYNKDAFLNLKANLYRRGRIETDSSGFFLGRLTREASDTQRPGAQRIRSHVVPRLRTLLKDDSREMRYSAAVALGRVGGPEDVPYLVALLKDPRYSVREAAATGLALLRVETARPTLHALLENERAARDLCNGQPIYDGIRGVAAIGLALLESDASRTGESARALLLKHARSRREHHHVPMMATISLGLVRGDATEVHEVVDALFDIAKPGSKANAWARAQALVSIGRVLAANHHTASPATLKRLIKFLRGSDVHQRRSAAIALGLAPSQDRTAAVKALRDRLLDGKDSVVRGFSAISLGRIGGADAEKALTRSLRKSRGETRVYAAIALGICASSMESDNTRIPRTRIVDLLRRTFVAEKNPDRKGGFAVALGIASDAQAGGALLSALKNARDVRFRGDCAVAIGMIGHREATDTLLQMLDEAGSQPRLKEHLAIGLGLMGARCVVPPLVSSLKTEQSAYALSAASHALGLVGDRTAVDPLLKLVGADTKLTRIYACTALGAVGDNRDLPLLNAVRANHNYLASCTELNYMLTTVDR